jgi:hypothetical protein
VCIEATENVEITIRDIWKPGIELDDLEAVVHARHKQVVPAVLRRVPFCTPDSTPTVGLLERSKGFTCVKEANFFVVTERESAREFHSDGAGKSPSYSYEMFDMRVGLDRSDSRFEAV